jgi:hypothetical protein
MLETRGLICRQDLGKGRFVYRPAKLSSRRFETQQANFQRNSSESATRKRDSAVPIS